MGDLRDVDFTILVAMGEERATDRFYVLPSRVVRKALADRRDALFGTLKPDGLPRKETGQITLWLRGNGEHRGFGEKWKSYLDGWDLLSR